ncbi:MAG: class I tRNA ligase family protein [Candidatus Peribacteria bacterium]|jgi:valyl-tRNA synthetase|nr:class I tRNA ligase family protein [Candidatus Peribacteria bacterium]
MSNKYNLAEAEAKRQAFREENQTNAFDPTKTDPNQTFSIDTPPPTVSGKLHIGHIFSYTQAEIIARYKRMKGFNVFYPMGYDDNGIPTEQLVEKELKINIKELERKEFVQKCLEVNQKYRDLYKALWQSLGFSVDWKRTYATISPEVQQLVQKRFVEMYQKGDIVGKQFPALRCTKMQTTVAQAETEEKEFNEFFNYLHFTLDDGEKLVIATTRPEMLPACVAVFAHPDDERFAKYIGRKITTPLGNTVPLLGDDKVKMDKGS